MITRGQRKRRFEFWKIAPQSFPASVAESAAAGFAGTVEAGWACQDTATGLLSYSGVAAQTLVSSGGAGVVMGQPAVGLFDGASFRTQKAAEFQPGKGGANRYACAAGATFDRDWTNPWSELIVWRVSGGPTSPYRGLQMKGPYAGPAWGLFLSTAGGLFAHVSDGAAHIVSLGTALSAYADGAWHWAYARWNPTDDTLRLDTDLETGLSSSTATITTSTVPGSTFGFGDWDATSALEGQIRGCILFSDVATTVTSIQAWWKHGAVPSTLSSYTRASSFSSIVADDATTGDVVRTVATGQYALGYNALISTNALKLGLESWAANTNLLPDTNMNLTAVWVNTTGATGTTALYNADSPRGFREAILHTKTAAGDMNLTAAAKGAAVTTSDTGAGALTITINAVAKTATRTGGSYVTDGFAAGRTATISGFVNGGNNTTKTVATVTASVLTFTDGTGLVDEASAAARVISGNLYTAHVECRWAGAVTAPELRVYRADGTTLIGTVSATDGTSKWRRLTLTFQAVNDTGGSETVRIAVSGAAAASTSGSAWFSLPMVNNEDFAKPWIQTIDATASTAAIVSYGTLARMSSDYGAMKVWSVEVLGGASKSLSGTRMLAMVCAAAGGVTTSRRLYFGAGVYPTLLANAAQANLSPATDQGTVESVTQCQWDASSRYGWRRRVARIPTAVSGAPVTENTALEAVGNNASLNIGHQAGAIQLCGLISQIDVWPGVEVQA